MVDPSIFVKTPQTKILGPTASANGTRSIYSCACAMSQFIPRRGVVSGAGIATASVVKFANSIKNRRESARRIIMFREASMLVRREWMLLALLLTAPITAATGNVVTDWDEKAVAILQPGTVRPPETSFRTMAILHLAMFDAVNSIEPRYKPYKVRVPSTPDMSKEAAAAAAGAVLVKLVPDAAADVQSALTSYLATLPDG